jgi:hypothetical protein
MIFSDSRYANAVITKNYNTTRNTNAVVATRVFPIASSKFAVYVWTEKDRIDLVAYRFLGSPENWWKIMDYNPELSNPMEIPIGTYIRIPRD